MTQAASQEEAVRRVGDTWDTRRSVAALAEAGHEATDKRARQILRYLAAVGLLVKTEPGQAVYSAVEQ
ncbi:hypothetical protein JL475_35210 [Streptomyces sp. M2CJ-2]|nr:hypothetical protein [Streptomyces sp. M2CJ-2]